MSIGTLLKHLRHERNLSQQQLAKTVSIDVRRISFYENDKMLPSTEVLIKLAKFFHVSVDYLLAGKIEGVRKFSFQDHELVELLRQVDRSPDKDRDVIKEVLRAFILKNKIIDLSEFRF